MRSFAPFFFTAVAWFWLGLPGVWNLLIHLSQPGLDGHCHDGLCTGGDMVRRENAFIPGAIETTSSTMPPKFALLAALLHTAVFGAGYGLYLLINRVLPSTSKAGNRQVLKLLVLATVSVALFAAIQAAAASAFANQWQPLFGFATEFFAPKATASFSALTASTLSLAFILGYVFAESYCDHKALFSTKTAWVASSLLKSFVFAYLVIKVALVPAWQTVVVRQQGAGPAPFALQSDLETPFIIGAAFTQAMALTLGMLLTHMVDSFVSTLVSWSVLRQAPAIRSTLLAAVLGLFALSSLVIYYGWISVARSLTLKSLQSETDETRSVLFIALTYALSFFLGVLVLEKQSIVSHRGILALSVVGCVLAVIVPPPAVDIAGPDTITGVRDLVSQMVKSINTSAQAAQTVALETQPEGFALGVAVALAGLFFFYLAVPSASAPSKKEKPYALEHNPDDVIFDRRRRKAFPPPYPNGWFSILPSRAVKPGEVKSINCLGRDMVVFRGSKSKEVTVMHAFCTHIGAHLGEGGRVIQDTLECPFHGWRFNQEGECVHIPYSDAKIPQQANNKTYHVRERLGVIWIWFDAEGRDPLYEMYDWSDVEDRTKWYHDPNPHCLHFKQHIAEMHENSGDYYHFETLHGPLPFPGILRPLMRLSYNLDLRVEKEEGLEHIAYLDNRTYINLLHCYDLKFSEIDTKLVMDGPGSILFRVMTPFGEVRSLKTMTPKAPFHTYSEDYFFAEHSVPYLLVYFIKKSLAAALEQDRPVWANKTYVDRPVFVKGDEPFKRFRKWYSQFYSDNSHKAAEVDLSW